MFFNRFYARYHPVKNHKLFLKSLNKLRSENFRIFLAGRNINHKNKELNKLIKDNKLELFTTLGDNLDRDELIEAYSNTDITVLTSISESFPNVIGESMSCSPMHYL